MAEILVQGLNLGAGLAVKWYAFVFLRLLPIGSRYLPIILSCTLVYLASYFTLRSLAQKPTRTSTVTPILALGGLYHPAYWRLSTAGALVTLVAPLLSYDFVYRAHFLHPSQHISFARVGWVTETSASLLLRSTVPDQVDVSYWPSHDSTAVSHAELSQSSLKTDFTSRLYIEDLQPGITYFYNSTAGHKGSFTTRRSKHDQKQFNLLSSSCQKPNWPYNPLSHSLAISGLEHVDKVIRTMERKPEAMLFLGDFVYSDLPYPTADYTASYYRRLYRQIYSSPSWTPLLRSIPWLHMFDDHEIINDYAPSSSALSDMFIQAIDPFINYQQVVNPPPISFTQPTYFRFEIGDVSFFVLDCRSWRSTQPARPGANSTAGFGNRTMLGESQLTAVKEWAEEGTRDGKLLVLVSGVPITRNWSEGKDEMDSWAGYLDEREEILEMLWSSGGAVVISGDRHEHATTLFPPPPTSPHRSSSVIEFSTSPLSFFHQPWTREYIPHPATDIPIHLQWQGNSRFGVFEFDTTGERPKVKFELVVDGEREWEYEWVKGADVIIPDVWQA
ncbi:hypothetical protein I308_104495 [Cryptococcus tetragattii IND107]|uniref:PhoD-like phosphatase metallophosphatase domain-containing protein n=1 Tax=Cryptococcus tetragattii IND107 TaxID=1296105 RepID=A0ABR3BQI7_9TREE